VYHLLRMSNVRLKVRIKIYALIVFVTLLFETFLHYKIFGLFVNNTVIINRVTYVELY
jgi:hypothetical protein